MDCPSLFPDISPIEGLFDLYFCEDDDCNSNCTENQQHQMTTSESGDIESSVFESLKPELSGGLDSSPPRPERVQNSSKNFTEDDLVNLPIRELNKRLRNLPEDVARKIRKRRRSLKNREYATNCRRRRAAVKDSLTTQNQRLTAQLRDTKKILSETTKERDSYRNKYESLQKIYTTLCTTSSAWKSRKATAALT